LLPFLPLPLPFPLPLPLLPFSPPLPLPFPLPPGSASAEGTPGQVDGTMTEARLMMSTVAPRKAAVLRIMGARFKSVRFGRATALADGCHKWARQSLKMPKIIPQSRMRMLLQSRFLICVLGIPDAALETAASLRARIQKTIATA
jgi:hypothetical protein